MAAGKPQTDPAMLDALLALKVKVEVRFGGAELPLQDLAELRPGSYIRLDRLGKEPLELVVGDKTVATGEIVEINGRYGIRITKVLLRGEDLKVFQEAHAQKKFDRTA